MSEDRKFVMDEFESFPEYARHVDMGYEGGPDKNVTWCGLRFRPDYGPEMLLVRNNTHALLNSRNGGMYQICHKCAENMIAIIQKGQADE